MTDKRQPRAVLLAHELNIDPAELPTILDRYAATATQATCPEGNGYLQTFPNFPDACADLGDGVLEGYLPAGVYDLDTGELIELHVSTPVVSKSEDQGITQNPLQPTMRPAKHGPCALSSGEAHPDRRAIGTSHARSSENSSRRARPQPAARIASGMRIALTPRQAAVLAADVYVGDDAASCEILDHDALVAIGLDLPHGTVELRQGGAFSAIALDGRRIEIGG